MTQDMNKYAALDYDFSVPNINCASLMCYKRGQPDIRVTNQTVPKQIGVFSEYKNQDLVYF